MVQTQTPPVRSMSPRLVASYAVTIQYEGQEQRFVVVASDIAEAARLAVARLRERSTEGRILGISFIGEAVVG